MDCGSAAPAAGTGPGSELPASQIHVACRAEAVAEEGGPEAKWLLPGGQSRQRVYVQAHGRVEDPRTGNLFDKGKSMTEQHREEQRSTLEWLRGWGQIKVQGQTKRRGKLVPKRPQIVSTKETTLQQGLRLSGYTALARRQ